MKNLMLFLAVLVLFALTSLAVCLPMQEGKGYANRKIQYLAETLRMQKMPGKDTLVNLSSLVSNKDVVFRYNEKNELAHLGISLFSRETKDLLDAKICDFLERVILELLLQGDKEGVVFKLKEYKMQLWMDGKDYAENTLWSLSNFIEIMKMPTNFSINYQHERASAIWTFDTHKLELVFPLYRELIEGTDKKESDYELYNRIREATYLDVKVEHEDIEEASLVKKSNGIYVLPGEKFQIKELSSDLYYVKQNDKFELIFQEDYPTFSLNNLFLSRSYERGITLQLMHRQYGHFTPEISIRLANFLEFFRKDFTVTCHTAYNKQGDLETIVVMNHVTLNYLHLLRVCISKEDLFKPNPTLKGDFYSNIPQHYIKSLIK